MESQGPGAGRTWNTPRFVLLAAFLGMVVVAAVIVVRNVSKIEPAETPVTLAPVPVESCRVMLRAAIRAKLERLEDRLKELRGKVAGPSRQQDSLLRVCDSGFALVRAQLGALDSAPRKQVRPEMVRTKRVYDDLKRAVADFTRTVLEATPEPPADSLDEEMERLLRE